MGAAPQQYAVAPPPKREHFPDPARLLARMKRCAGGSPDARAVATACAEAVSLWAAICDGPQQLVDELLALWPAFLAWGTAALAADPAACARPLLEAVVTSAAAAVANRPAAEANAAAVEAVVAVATGDIRGRTEAATTLVPPLLLLHEATRLAELVQEYHLVTGQSGAGQPPASIQFIEAMNAIALRYSRVFVEEVAFPAYWSVDWQSSSTILLVDGTHPTILFFFSAAAGLVRRWRGYPPLLDDRPCRQLLAQLWERGAAAIACVVEERELSAARKQQLQLDVLHYVMFARMFREFIGERLFQRVTPALTKLLGAAARLVPVKSKAAVVRGEIRNFVADIWDVPPVAPREWALPAGAFVPWSETFLRATHLQTARAPPNGWERQSFGELT